MTPMDVNAISSRLKTTVDVPDSCQEPDRKGGDTAKVIIIPTETANIDIRKHFTHEVIQNGQMLLVKVPTSAQMADFLTKGLHLPQVLACVDGLLHQRLCPQEGVARQGCIVKSRPPLRGVFRRLIGSQGPS